MKSDSLPLKSIIQYCDCIIDDLSYYGYDEETFYESDRFQRSCAFSLIQIGECVKNLSESIKNENPQIDWKGVYGMRNIVTHAYSSVNLHYVWVTLTKDVPVLKEECVIILNKL